MAWREIMNKDISLLCEHNAFICHFNIMNNITLVFCTIHVAIDFSQKRQTSVFNGSPDLHAYWRFYSSLNTLSMMHCISYSVCAKHDNGVNNYDCEIQTNVNVLRSVPTEGIYPYA